MSTLLAGALLAGCASVSPVARQPTVPPVLRVTPAPTQDVAATQTVLTVNSIPTPTPQGQYIVKPGDTLSSIADRYETTVDEIIALNNIADPNAIEVGQSLIIPSLVSATPEVSETATNSP